MLEKLRKFFTVPVFEDEGVNFNARNLNVVLLSVFLGIVITILRYIALGKFWQGNAGVVFLATGVVIGGAYIMFQKRYVLASSMVAIVVLTLMPFALILMSGNGIHDTAIMILPVAVVITSMLLPWQGLVGYVVFVALAYGVLVRMEVNLNLVTPFSKLTTNSDFTDALTILIVAGLMSGLLVASLRRNLRRLSDALKERKISEERYRAVVENQTEFIVRWKPDGTRTFVNDAYCRFFDLAPEQAISTSFFPLLMDEDRIAAETRISRLMSGDIGAESYIQRVNKPDGSLSWQEWTDQIVRGETGQVLEFQSVGRDITDRKHAEDQLRESEDRYRRVIEAAGAVPYYQDFRFDKYEFMGQEIQKITGYLPEEMTASLWDSIVQGSELIGDLAGLGWEDAIARIRTGEHDVWKCDYRVLTKSGQIKWIADTAIDLFGNDGKSYASIGIMQDITERKKTEETLRKQAEQMSALYDIGLTITSNLDLDQILYDLYEKCRQLLPIDTFYIAVYDEASQLIRHPLFYDGNQKGFIQVNDRNIEIAPGVSGHIILSKTTLYLPNFNDPVVQEKYKIVRVGSMLLAGSYVGVPILAHDAVIGVISMQKMEPDAYSSEQIRLLETIATQAAIAIENARLYQAEQERRREAETLRNSLTNVVTLFELEGIVESILDQIKLVIPYDTASVWRVDGEWLTLIVGRDLPPELPADLKMPIDDDANAARQLLIQGEIPFILRNKVQEELTNFKGPHSYINSWLVVPLKKRGRIIGQIALDGKSKGQFTVHHADLAIAFADQVAIALENASLYEEIQQELSERTRVENALRESEALYRKAIEVAGAVPYHQIYPEGEFHVHYDFIGDGIREITGYGPEEFNEKLWDSIVQERNLFGELAQYSWREAVQRVRTGVSPIWQCEQRIRARNGESRWVYEAAVELRDKDGQSHGSLGLFQDITERKLAEEKLLKRAEQLVSLNEIGRSISSLRNLESVLIATLEQIRRILKLDAYFVGLYHPETNTISFPLVYDSEKFWQEPEVSIDTLTSYVTQVRNTHQPFLLNRTAEEIASLTPDHQSLGAIEKLSASIMMVPMEIDNRFIGVVSVQSYTMNAYDIDDLMLLNNASNQIAIAVENARLYESERMALEQSETLRESAAVVTATLDKAEAIDKILEQLKRVVPYNSASVQLIEMDHLVIVGVSGLSDATVMDFRFPINEQEPSYPVLRERQPYILFANVQEFAPGFNEIPHNGIRSWLAVPLRVKGRIIGIIALDGHEANQFNDRHARLVVAFANQVAIALENSRLFSEVQQELIERKRAEDTLRQRDAVLQAVAHAAQVLLQSSDWRESITQILDELGWATGASHVYIFENHVLANDKKVTSLKYEWTSSISKPDIDNPQYQNSPLFEDDKMYWSGILSKGQTYIGDMDKLPVEEAEHFRLQGIKSILDVPIFVAGEWWGVIGFDDFVNERAWSQAEIEALEIAGKMMGAAIEREQIDESLRTSEERYRRAISANDSVPYTLDYQKDEYTFMGEMIDQITGYPVNEITPDKMRVLIQETIMRGDLDGYSRSEATELIRTGELHPRSWRADLRIITKDRDERWLSDSSIQILDKNGKPIGSIGILQDITDRKLVEVNLRKRESLLNAITFSAEQFLKTPNWREKIDVVLARLGKEFNASHAYIFEKNVRADGVILNSLRYEWVAPGQNSDMDNPVYLNAPIHEREHARYYEILNSGLPFVGSTSFLLESESEKAWMNATSIKALLEMRIVVNGVQWGTIGFDDMVSEREWNPMEVDVIKIAANVLAAAIEREQADNIIRQSEEKYRNELEGQVIERTSQLTAANKLLQTEKTRIEQVVDEVATLRRLSDFLQSSMTVDEASGIVASHMSSLFMNTSGGLYLINDGFIDLALMSSWGEFKTEAVIQPNDCWGMRRGRSFVRHTSDASPVCAHFDGEIPDESLCLPLMGQNEIIGMLCVQVSKNEKTYFTSDIQNLAIACADSVALALANLRLRERLRTQTIRDPLTGIFNRRYLEETLEREVHRAGRNQEPLCVVMFEIDDFKQYNNTFGHDAGDYVLKKVADTMQSNLRKSDFPCRYGGDEFTFLLPNTNLENGAQRAEELRKAVAALALSFNNQALGQVTVRMGVAAYPKHGESGEVVLKVADDASYRARAIGKNCVVVAE